MSDRLRGYKRFRPADDSDDERVSAILTHCKGCSKIYSLDNFPEKCPWCGEVGNIKMPPVGERIAAHKKKQIELLTLNKK